MIRLDARSGGRGATTMSFAEAMHTHLFHIHNKRPSGRAAINRHLKSRIGSAIWGAVGTGCALAVLVCGGGAGTDPAELSATPSEQHGIVQGDSSGTCARCHQMDAVLSHPVDMVPSATLPPQFPLADGRVTCLTCHEVAPSHGGNGGGTTFRGGASAASLCAECHSSADAQGRAPHWMAVERAHLRTPQEMSAGPALNSHGLDAESLSCMQCHDGAMARDAGDARRSASFEFGSAADHPIGIAYQPRSGRESTPLRPHSAVDDRIRLFEGIVGCGSCHSVYSPKEDLLVMSNLKSALCLSCHDY